jgi:hypothetical protein
MYNEVIENAYKETEMKSQDFDFHMQHLDKPNFVWSSDNFDSPITQVRKNIAKNEKIRCSNISICKVIVETWKAFWRS